MLRRELSFNIRTDSPSCNSRFSKGINDELINNHALCHRISHESKFRWRADVMTPRRRRKDDACLLRIINCQLTTRLYDKRDDFNFPIVNFSFLSSNIPSAPAYGVYVSQLIRYARTCSNYQDFMERGKVLTQKLLSQGFQKTKLVATLKKFYGRHHDLVNPYNVAVSRIVSDVFASDAP